MNFRQLAAAFFVAFVSTSAAPVQAQGTTSTAPPVESTGRDADPAAQNKAHSGPPKSDRTPGSEAAASGDQGTITRAGKDKPGRIGKDGSLPKPNVQDDPQHRCLSPAGIC